MKKKKGTMFKTILGSYIIICMVIVGITMVINTVMSSMLKKEMIENASVQADVIQKQFESNLTGIQNVLESISEDQRMLTFLEYEDVDFQYHYKEVHNYQEAVQAEASRYALQDIYTYFIDNHSVLGANSRRYRSDILESFCQSKNLSMEEFQNITDYQGLYHIYVPDTGKVWMMRSVYQGREKSAVLIAEIEVGRLLNNLDSFYRNIDVIMFREEAAFFTTRKFKEEPAYRELRQASIDGNKISVDQVPYYILSKQISSWLDCFICVPTSNISQSLQMIYVMIIFEIIGSVIWILFMSRYFSNRLYAPVYQVMKALDVDESFRFHQICEKMNSNLNGLIKENHLLLHKISFSVADNHRKQFREIFEKGIGSLNAIGSQMQECCHIGPADPWLLAVLHPEKESCEIFQCDPMYPYTRGDDVDIMSFIFDNVIHELVFDNYEGNVIELGDDLLLIVKLDSAEKEQALDERLRKVMEFFKSTVKLNMFAVVGSKNQGYELLIPQYHAVSDEVRYRTFWKNESENLQIWKLPEYEENRRGSQREYLPAARRLINCLESDDYVKAYDCLKYILDEVFCKDRKNLDRNIYRMYGLISMIEITLQRRVEKDANLWVSVPDFEEQLFGIQSMMEFRKVSEDIFHQLIQYNELQKENSGPAWIQEAVEFLEKNYKDINMSVTMVADHLNVSSAHLSRTFKLYMNNGVLEYMYRLRIEEAKRLLDQGYSVKSTAQNVGYLDAKALIRTFKRYEGITPGQYQAQQKPE